MALHIAASSINYNIPSDIFGGLIRENDMIHEPIEFENAAIIVPQGDGLGVC